MPMINLLPWREELRQKRKKEFLLAILGAVIVAGALTFGTKMFFQARISNQEARNNMLRAEITELDRQIEEINRLDAEKQRLLDRLEIIEELERTTPEAVTLVDSLADIMLEGTYLTSVAQTGANIRIEGRSQSNQRISDMMREIYDSTWLEDPELDVVQNTDSGPQRQGQFTMLMEQVQITGNEEALQ